MSSSRQRRTPRAGVGQTSVQRLTKSRPAATPMKRAASCGGRIRQKRPSARAAAAPRRAVPRKEASPHGGARTPPVGAGEGIDVKRRIRDDQPEPTAGIERLHGGADHLHPLAPGRSVGILPRLRRASGIDLDRRDPCRRALRQHQGDQSGARADIENTFILRLHAGPGAEQHTVCADLHRAAILPYRECFEPEHGCNQANPSIPAPNRAKSYRTGSQASSVRSAAVTSSTARQSFWRRRSSPSARATSPVWTSSGR